MSQLSYSQLEQLWISNGGSPSLAPLMAAVALAESTGNTNSVNPGDPAGGSYGLWQINGAHAPGGNADSQQATQAGWINAMFDPNQNAAEAVQVYNSQGLGAWRGDAVAAAVLAGKPIPAAYTGGQGPITATGQQTNSDLAAQGTVTPGACDDAVYIFNLSPYHFINQCQARAILGGTLMAVGGLGMVISLALVVAAFGLRSKAGKVAEGVVGVKYIQRQAGQRSTEKRAQKTRAQGPRVGSKAGQKQVKAAYSSGEKKGRAAKREEIYADERQEAFDAAKGNTGQRKAA